MKKFYILFLYVSFTLTSYSQDYAWALPLGSSQYDGTSCVVSDSNGNVVVTGHVQGTMDLDPGAGILNVTSNGSSDVFVGKYNPNGDLIWGFSYGGVQFESASTVWIDAFDNIYIGGGFRLTVDFDPGAGVFNMTSAGHLDIYILKLDPGGNFLWAKQVGGFEEDSVEGIATNANNELLVTGLFYGTVDFDPNGGVQELIPTGAQDAYIFKWTADGDFVWAKKFGTTSGEIPYDITIDGSGNVYATGLFWGNLDFDPNGGTFFLNAGGFNSKAFVLKWDTDGNFIWAGMFGGSLATAAYELVLDVSGNIIVGGSFAGTGDFDPGAGTFNLTGDVNPLYHNIFVVKLDNAGVFTWAKNVGSDGFNQAAYAIDVTPTSEIWLSGSFSGTVDFDPGAGVSSLTAPGSSDGFLLEFDSSGNYLFSGAFSGSQDDYCNSIDIHNNSALFVGGLFTWSNTDLDPTTGVDLFNSNSNTNDGFVVKLGLQECPATYGSTTVNLCPGDSVEIAGTWESVPGIYTDYLVNLAGCDSIMEITLQFYPAMEVLVFSTPALCGSSTGTAIASATGVEPFQYLWDDLMAQTTPTAIDLVNGTYHVLVTDGNGCSTSTAIIVELDNGCNGDYNFDGVVNVEDLLQFISFIGCFGNCCPYDGDQNNVVNVNDLLIFMANFGIICE